MTPTQPTEPKQTDREILAEESRGSRIWPETTEIALIDSRAALSAMARARETEREVCAQVIEDMVGTSESMLEAADAIRARNTGKGEK